MPYTDANSRRLFQDAIGLSDNPSKRDFALVEIIAVLLQEIEALRRVVAQLHPDEYARAYEAAAEVAHDSAGVAPPLEKLLALFVDGPDGGNREDRLLASLGYSPADLERVARRLAELHTLT
jgi:hypothetical protein